MSDDKNTPMPCPFCGSPQVSTREGDTFRWRVAYCGDCGAVGPEVRMQTVGPESMAERVARAACNAIKEWNKRTER